MTRIEADDGGAVIPLAWLREQHSREERKQGISECVEITILMCSGRAGVRHMKFEEGSDGVLPPEAFTTGMGGTSSSSPPSGEDADAWTIALESAGGERLRTLLRRMVGSAEVTEDILQNTREKFLRHVGEGRRASGRWARKVAHSLAVTYVRQKYRHAEVVLPEEALELTSASTRVESEAEYQQSVQRFLGDLEALPAEQQRLIELHYRQGLKAKEIARLCGKSVEAIEQRLTRVRKRLLASVFR